ncbi:tRNA 2-thiocytidine(32) synthetase TtcA [Salinisphaera hydrothermalis]|uniref:tRNA-cytidine(32) 2-sulfurtransferase n=1 Tax=Salinisphaera hydrothermalis (strain C41B8) TaxID=1304275 RepID=A0A084IJ91_SALHC|nr:tRNA 2-thiocytidine(32) synthetase TtcA [Salinisphaera hydrothermalis]KEZ76775.1 tRNA 2-thiocytidine biosynthesis protein TtcA [Salinisphaera hydrothermalis C41B8]
MSDIPVLDTRAPAGLTPGSNAAEKLTKRLRRQAGQAIVDYGMIREGERIMVCLSGGKDSYTLLDTLLYLQQVAPVSFTLRAVNLDQKQPGFPEHILPNYLSELGVDYEIIERDTYSVVTEKIEPGATMCGLCSRLRRGILYRYARENGFTRIALGHHRDDIVETMFLNMFHGARMAAMPPKLKSDDGDNVVIRPLAYCAEAEIEKYARLKQFPIIPCNLCGSQENLARQNVKAMLADWERIDPGRSERIFRSMTRIAPSQMADNDLFDFAGLETDADRG